MNIRVDCHAGNYKRGKSYILHPLDEVQERIDQWKKRVLLCLNEDSWKNHSSNVTSVHMCVNFEEFKYIKKNPDYSTGVNNAEKNCSVSTTVPKYLIENQ